MDVKTNIKESEWMIWKNAYNHVQMHCKECGYRLTTDEKRIPEYCPSCGAHMAMADIPFSYFIDLLTRHRGGKK